MVSFLRLTPSSGPVKSQIASGTTLPVCHHDCTLVSWLVAGRRPKVDQAMDQNNVAATDALVCLMSYDAHDALFGIEHTLANSS